MLFTTTAGTTTVNHGLVWMDVEYDTPIKGYEEEGNRIHITVYSGGERIWGYTAWPLHESVTKVMLEALEVMHKELKLIVRLFGGRG